MTKERRRDHSGVFVARTHASDDAALVASVEGDGNIHDEGDGDGALPHSGMVGNDICCIPHRFLNAYCYEVDSSDSDESDLEDERDVVADLSELTKVLDLEKVSVLKSADDSAKKKFPSWSRVRKTMQKTHERFQERQDKLLAGNSIVKKVNGSKMMLFRTLFDVGFQKPLDTVGKNIEKELAAAQTKNDVKASELLMSIRGYHTKIMKGHNNVRASLGLVEVLYTSRVYRHRKHGKKKTSPRYYAMKIRNAYKELVDTGTITPDRRGKGKGESRICSDEFKMQCLDIIAALEKKSWKWSATEFQFALEDEMKEKNLIHKDKHFSKKTITFYLSRLGFAKQESKKQTYKDGHERKDVLEDRHRYTTRMFALVDRMDAIETNDRNAVVLIPPKDSTQKKIVPVTCTVRPIFVFNVFCRRFILTIVSQVCHDECVVASNEDRSTYWCKEDEEKLEKKSKGGGIMISGFICPCHGRMAINAMETDFSVWLAERGETDIMTKYTTNDKGITYASFKTIEPGAKKEGWWDGDDVYQQVIEVMRIFEYIHGPDAIGMFIFDNSTNHGKFTPDALYLSSGNSNLNPGGTNAPGSGNRPKMRDGYYYKKNEATGETEKIVQKMHIESGPDEGLFKGSKLVSPMSLHYIRFTFTFMHTYKPVHMCPFDLGVFLNICDHNRFFKREVSGMTTPH